MRLCVAHVTRESQHSEDFEHDVCAESCGSISQLEKERGLFDGSKCNVYVQEAIAFALYKKVKNLGCCGRANESSDLATNIDVPSAKWP